MIIGCVAVFFIQSLAPRGTLELLFGLSPYSFIHRWWLWQPVTYLFLHDPGNIFHLVFNMLMLWMFGADLERRWGTQPFIQFYMVCGIGAGLLSVAMDILRSLAWPDPLTGGLSLVPTIGASGAIYGLLAAHAILFPDRMLLLFLVFPMRMRPAVLIMTALTFFAAWNAPGSGINHVAHLGGMAFAWIYLHRAWNLRRTWADWRWRMHRRKYRILPDIHDDDHTRYH
ncbi:MAG: rhomboid family intramembrane serine protease [Acidobacteriota bacterium]